MGRRRATNPRHCDMWRDPDNVAEALSALECRMHARVELRVWIRPMEYRHSAQHSLADSSALGDRVRKQPFEHHLRTRGAFSSARYMQPESEFQGSRRQNQSMGT